MVVSASMGLDVLPASDAVFGTRQVWLPSPSCCALLMTCTLFLGVSEQESGLSPMPPSFSPCF